MLGERYGFRQARSMNGMACMWGKVCAGEDPWGRREDYAVLAAAIAFRNDAGVRIESFGFVSQRNGGKEEGTLFRYSPSSLPPQKVPIFPGSK